MVILDLEYYLSSYINNIKSSSIQYLPQFPDCIPLGEYGNWKPNSNSIFNLLLNFPNYSYTDFTYMFKRITTPSEAYVMFENYFLRERICSMLVHEDVYIANPNGTENILSFNNEDLLFINDVLQNPNLNVFNYTTNNPVIYSFMFLVSTVQKPTNLEPLVPENNINEISEMIYFTAMNNQFMTSLANNVSQLA